MIYFLDYSFENNNFVPIQREKKEKQKSFFLYKVEVLGLGLSYKA